MSEVNNVHIHLPNEDINVDVKPTKIDAEKETVLNPAAELKKLVEEKVKGAVGAIKDSVVDTFAKQEISKIEAAVIKAVTDLDGLKKELNKIRASEKQEEFDGDGKVIREFYTKDGNKKLKDALQKISNVEKAIESALIKADYKPILNLNKPEQKG